MVLLCYLVGISDFTYLTEPTPGIQVQLVSKLLGGIIVATC